MPQGQRTHYAFQNQESFAGLTPLVLVFWVDMSEVSFYSILFIHDNYGVVASIS
jgi:hypothetical protein